MRELYAPFTRTGAPIMMMDTASAELCKYAANSILATRISFMNEIANVCELVGADVDQVRKAIGSDRRIGTSFLFPGVGYGGSCFPKDVQGAAAGRRPTRATTSRFCDAVEAVNEPQKARLVEQDGGALRRPARADDRGLGPGVQAAHRRHARGAGDRRSSSGCSRAARRCGRTIRRRAPTARRLFGDRIALCEKSYDALDGRRRAGDRHRVERVPRAGLREDARSC